MAHSTGARHFLQAQAFPEFAEQEGSSQGDALDKAQGLGLFPQGSLNLEGVFRGKKTAEAFDQSFDGFQVQGVGAAEESIVISTPEPTSITNANTLIKVLATKHKKKNFTHYFLLDNSEAIQYKNKEEQGIDF